jgi:hypothetical protein
MIKNTHWILPLFALLLSGCIQADKVLLEFAIQPDFSAEVTVLLQGLHAQHKDHAKAESEWQEYVSSGHKKAAQALISGMGLEDATSNLTGTEQGSTDLRIHGRSPQVVRALSTFAGKDGFVLKHKDDILTVELNGAADAEPKEEPGNTRIVITYPGTILSHNAHNFDPEFGRMTWYQNQMTVEGLRFILK